MMGALVVAGYHKSQTSSSSVKQRKLVKSRCPHDPSPVMLSCPTEVGQPVAASGVADARIQFAFHLGTVVIRQGRGVFGPGA